MTDVYSVGVFFNNLKASSFIKKNFIGDSGIKGEKEHNKL